MAKKKLGWLSVEGTNSASTCSTLGTNFHLRRGMIRQAWKNGYEVNFFGCKKDGYLWDDNPHKGLHDYFSVTEVVNKALRRYTEIAKRKNSKIGNSQSRWIVSKSIDYVLKNAKFPKCDIMWVEFMDPGLPSIVLSVAVMIHYARQNIPLFVRDGDIKFRYITTLKPLHPTPRENMYEERIQRYISDAQLEEIRHKFVLIYAFDTSWAKDDPFVRAFETVGCLYDPKNELPINFENKKKRLTYVGNVNGREDACIRFYGNSKWPVHIWGRWPSDAMERVGASNEKIKFKGIVDWDDMLPVYNRAKASVHITRKDYSKLGSIPERQVEVAQAGTLLLVPEYNTAAENLTLVEFIIKDEKDMNVVLKEINEMDEKAYVATVEDFRSHLHDQFSPSVTWKRIMKMVKTHYGI